MVDHDEAMDRLRASDPATGAHPDLHRLRALIAHKAPASQGSDEVTRLDDDLLRGPRLRTPWIAAAAVAALAMGAGGYALGMQQSPAPEAGPTVVEPAAPGLDLATDGLAQSGTDGAQTQSGAATVVEEASGDGPMAWDPGAVRLSAGEDLPAGPGTAEVRALVSEREPQEVVDALAEHLGMDPRPLPDGEAWGGTNAAAGGLDPAQGKVVQADRTGGPLNFHYEDIYGNPWCAEMFAGLQEEDLAVVRQDWAASYGPDLPLPDESSCRPATGPAPTEEEARAAAEEFFAAVGVDVAGYSMENYADADSSTVNLEFWPEGQKYGQVSLSATVSADGVVSAYGTIGELTSLGDYPVISAAEAVDRYEDRVWTMDFGVDVPEERVDDDGASWTEPAIEVPEPAPLSPGDPIPLLLKDKTVTGAELMRGTMWTNDSGSIEVPVWQLRTDDGMRYHVLALAEDAFDLRSW